MVSLRLDLNDGRTIEVASIGQEGAVGGIVSCGQAPAFAQAEVMVAGPALKIPMKKIDEAKERSAHIRNLFCRFSDYLLAQVMQSVACNAFHPIEARAARWLLTAQDRAGSRIELTQEALAGLLGAQRTTVNAVARTLAGRRPDRQPPGHDPGHRPGRAQAARMRMLRGDREPFRRHYRHQRQRWARLRIARRRLGRAQLFWIFDRVLVARVAAAAAHSSSELARLIGFQSSTIVVLARAPVPSTFLTS